MSTRTIIELNHDYTSEIAVTPTLHKMLADYMRNPSNLAELFEHAGNAIKVIGCRHHSEPEWRQQRRETVDAAQVLEVLIAERPTAMDQRYADCTAWDRGTCDLYNTMAIRMAKALFPSREWQLRERTMFCAAASAGKADMFRGVVVAESKKEWKRTDYPLTCHKCRHQQPRDHRQDEQTCEKCGSHEVYL